MKYKAVIHSLRLRTLPLSLSGVILGIFLAYAYADATPSWLTLLCLILTTLFLQVLSNTSNELGDSLSGTDRDDRQGLRYSLQSGALTNKDMRRMIIFFAVACCVSGAGMIYFSFGSLFSWIPLSLLALGAAAIWAATRYTLGKNPYGYRGLGDLFVFLFFGLVAVCGAYFICTHRLDWAVFLPAVAVGCFCVGVLNVNNIRDMESDAATRVTTAIKLGRKRAQQYQLILLVVGWLCMLVFTALTSPGKWSAWLYLLCLPLYIIHIRGVFVRNTEKFDSLLPMLVMSTFALALLAGIGMNV